ncbi:calcium-binding protein [Streptomyces sp. NPDC000410]|uniref:calcium-binding protein n=1 Tax=Streptomyces sp. NPDC000410 TaxID=3154254 RepID=UPI003327A05C
MPAAVLSAVIAAQVFTASPAHAATTVSVSDGRLTVTAASGEANYIEVTPLSSGYYLVRDMLDSLAAGTGCTPFGSGVRCSAAGVRGIVVNAGDMADYVRVSPLILVPAILRGEAGNDLMYAGGGPTRLDGFTGSDVLHGGPAKDELRGGSQVDTLHGGRGDDSMDSGTGSDRLFGGDDADDLSGGTGDDLLNGEAGNDVIRADEDADSLVGGAGFDSAVYSERTRNVNVSLDDRRNDGSGFSVDGPGDNVRSDVERVFGSLSSTNALAGNNGANHLYGGQSIDVIVSAGGPDFLVGLDGADHIQAGAGDDTIDAGSGNDTYLTGDARERHRVRRRGPRPSEHCGRDPRQ